MECQVCGTIYGDNSENGQSIIKTGCCCHCWANKPEKCEEISPDWNWTTCVNCQKQIEYTTDLKICDECSVKFDLDVLWKEHDLGEVAALDFNESESFREKYRKRNSCPACGEVLTMIYYPTYMEYHWREDHWSDGLIGDHEVPTGIPCGCRSWEFDELIEELN